MNEMNEVGRHNQLSVRIWLCGPFQLDWLDPVTGNASPYSTQDLQGRDSTQALSLLKLLLCQPERQAHRDWIMEQFWPEHSHSVATHRLENVFSRLRKLLIPPSGGESLLHSTRGKKNGGVLYSLSTYPRVWVDTDAVTWNVEQAARMERFGDDSLPFWQRAFDLLKRGPLLADEPYAAWVKERRELLEGYTRQCVHALARLYLARFGEAGKAEAILLLRTYWQQHKTDEDALRPLLELLGEQERYQEAEEYYQQLLLALVDLGSDEIGERREPDSRTSDIHEYLHTKQIRRNQVQSTRVMNVGEKESITLVDHSPYQPNEEHALPSPVMTHVKINLSPRTEHSPLSPPSQDIIREGDESERERLPMDTIRRHLLQVGIGAAGAFLNVTSNELHRNDLELAQRLMMALKKPSSIDEIFIAHLETATRNNRKRFVLSKNSTQDIRSLHQDVSAHLLTITQLLEHPHPMQTRLYTLAGETTQLLGDIKFYEGKNDAANFYYDMAIDVAVEAHNNVLQAVILGRKSFLPIYNGDARDALSMIQYAHELASPNAADSIRAWLLVIEAEAQAILGNAEACSSALQQCETFLRREHSGFSTYSFTLETHYAPLNMQRLLGYRGACYLRLGQPREAQSVLQTYLASMNKASLHKQSITLIDLAKTCALQREIEEMYAYADQALLLLQQTKSARVIQRILNLRQGLQSWQDTTYVKQLDQQLAAISSSS